MAVALGRPRPYTHGMDNYTIVPRGGIYRLEASGPDGVRRLVATRTTEQAAIALLHDLRQKAGLSDPTEHRPKDWRL
jgi:hypothetical protein